MTGFRVPGVPAPLHPAPFACAGCGETLLFNYVARTGTGAGDGYYFFAHLLGDRLFSYTIEKAEIQQHGGFNSQEVVARIEHFCSNLHELIDAQDFPARVRHMRSYSSGGPRDGAPE